MKPLGPIPPGFGAIDGELAIAGVPASTLVRRAGGTPLFVYSAAMIRAKVAALRAAMPGRLHIHYAVKANPYRPILELMSGLVDGFDIASAGELRMLREAGVEASRISFAGPGKRDAELAAAISAGVTINLELESEADRALAICSRGGLTPRLAIRVNPEFDLKGSGMKMGGGAKPFGLDAERVPALARRICRPARSGAAFTSLPAARRSVPRRSPKPRRRRLSWLPGWRAKAARRCRIATLVAVSAFPISPATNRSISA